ncbi:MAG TPA: hypothetical protein PLR41_06145 [Alphaproteobacteria bacterium]|nr:hypothetical protein [Alphaproteobacteria bacterium]
MTHDHLPLSVPLVSPNAEAAVKLRAELAEICARTESLAVEPGPLNETVLHGRGELELDTMIDYLKRGQGHDFQAGAPQVAYREAITKTIEWDYTYKRQTGGLGYYAKVKIRIAPGAPGSGVRFDTAAGDAVPAVFISAVLKGLRTAASQGPIAGFPLLDLHCTLVDGGYHDVDSTRETFEIAARACLREALPMAGPRLLQPMMLAVVLTPERFIGDVAGDLNSRRPQVSDMASHGTAQVITATVPLANMFGYPSALRSMTRGQAQCVMMFSHYEAVPLRPGPGDDDFRPAMALR